MLKAKGKRLKFFSLQPLSFILFLMSNRFPCAWPRAKQVVGQKGWLGFAGGFAFPGFKANWLYTSYNDSGAYDPASGEWTYSVSSPQLDGSTFNYTCAGSAPNFAVGDLVLREWPGAGPLTDYLTGLAWSYPKCYWVFICTAAITGSTADPNLDAAHWALWDFGKEGSYNDTPGPSGWPDGANNGRAVFAQTTNSAQLEVTVTTTLANFPLFPATITAAELATIGMTGANSDGSANSFSDMTVPECSAAGAFVYDWTFANFYDGTQPTYTAPATAPSSEQSPLIFPNVPPQRVVGWGPVTSGSGPGTVVDSLFFISGTQNPALVTWSFSASSITMEFAAWSWNSDVEYEFSPYHWGALASAPATITQTVALGGASYTLATVAAQCEALIAAVPFNSIAWGTSWTATYNSAGAVVVTPNVGVTVANSITEAGAVGTPVQGAVAINGCPFVPGETGCFLTAALVDVCGNYCTRTYAEGTAGPTGCSNGNVNGYAPVQLNPPATPGQSIALYAGCQCS
jgi:hypothetical protein